MSFISFHYSSYLTTSTTLTVDSEDEVDSDSDSEMGEDVEDDEETDPNPAQVALAELSTIIDSGHSDDIDKPDLVLGLWNTIEAMDATFDLSPYKPICGSCVICLEPIKVPSTLSRCGHLFCYSCLHQIPKDGRTVPCPICRKPGRIQKLYT